jgi:outer membrane protein OmpA-like peptidoglycan-associated protein
MQLKRTRLSPLLLLALATPAVAQDADTYELSASNLDGQGTLQRHSPHLSSRPGWYAGLGLSYANDPLVLRRTDGTETTVVGSMVGASLMGGYNFGGKARLDVAVPTYPSVNVQGTGQFALGDVRLGALVPLVSYDEEGTGVAVTPYVTLPTGDTAAFVTDGGLGGGLVASVGGQRGKLGWTVDAGVDLGKSATLGRTTTGSGVDAGAGVSYRVADAFLLGAELDQRLNLASSESSAGNPLEGHVYGTYGECRGLFATGGLGTGIVAGVGSPDVRVVAALGWRAAECGPGDTDEDGITDDVDQCIEQPEDFDGFEDTDGCPEDDDRDGVADADDACLREPGPKETGGCPDADGDGLADRNDSCPNDPGPEDLGGCPDRDGDRFLDKDDACPDEPGGKGSKNGCPVVILTKKAIQITDKVLFETDGDRILSGSFGLLDDVAKVILDHDQIARIEVQGHTDDTGSDSYNDQLSQRRAEAVRRYLVDKGVAADRLVAKGYGEREPVATNQTEDGKAKNRRVEFKILEQ